MATTNRIWNGVGWFLRGFRLVLAPGVKRYVAAPLAINVVLFAGALIAGGVAVYELAVWLQSMVPGWLEWLTWLLWPLYIIAALVVLFYVAGLVATVVAAPFMGPLAAAVEAHLRGELPPKQRRSRLRIVREAVPAVLSELYKLVYFVVCALPLLLLSLIPGLNLLAPPLWLLFGAWMLAREYLDPPLGNHDLSFRQQSRVVGQYRWAALGFGGAASVANTIPLVNFLILPVAVAGATAMVVEGMAAEFDPEGARC
ncbi:sulfate transporter CysZ [Halorhodospira abdelmalekii]|uniref:sulfate transporter CysZ n=1 Tax=Halorhodospira abdelmalekii TaxID=421629 RepID=UPI001903227C|nr:sulfate transporter CysZ [Halorhodospira abdelmalekii]